MAALGDLAVGKHSRGGQRPYQRLSRAMLALAITSQMFEIECRAGGSRCMMSTGDRAGHIRTSQMEPWVQPSRQLRDGVLGRATLDGAIIEPPLLKG
jgi:hypothetical protein